MITQTKFKKSTFVLVSLIILILTINNALALDIVNPQVPSEILAGNIANLAFETDVAVNSQNIYLDNNLLSNSNSYDLLTNTSNIGIHTIKFQATNNTSNETVEKEYLMTITGYPPEFTINEPSKTDYNYSDLTIEIESSEAELCYYIYENNTHTLTKNNNLFTDTITTTEGVSTLTIKCTANYATNQEDMILHIDTTEPQIISKTPTGNLNSNAVTLSVETDEIATCKYSSEDLNYEEMTLLGEENSVSHTKSLSINDGDHTYYFLCKDIYGNLMSASEQISFNIESVPTASINLEGDDIKKAGTYKIVLTTSEKLSEVPKLTYKFQEEGKTKSVSLVNENEDYESFEGYLIISEEQGEDIGEFIFSGKDENNNIGTEITQGKLFRIDTTKPQRVTSLKSKLTEEKNIVLDWFFEGEENINYYVYRSSNSGVGLTDYYKGTKEKTFVDNDVEEGASYFYKVAAVDNAGNIGELSEETQITIRNDKPSVNPSVLLTIEDMQKTITSKLFDIKGYTKQFNSEKDLLKNTVLNELGILEQLNKANLELKTIESNLEDLKQSQKSADELSIELETYATKIEKLNSEIIIDLEIDSSVEYQEIVEQSELTSIANEFFKSNPVNDKEKDVAKANALLDKTNINVKLIKATIEDSLNNKKEVLLVIKKYNSQEPLRNIFLVEKLSDEFALKSKEIIFKKNPLIINNGLVQYSFSNFQDEELSYYLFTDKSLNEVKNSKSVLFNKNNEIINIDSADPKEEGNLITANVLGADFLKNLGANSLFIIIGVIIIAGLLAYYFKMDSELESKIPNHTIINNNPNSNENNSLAIGLANLINQGLNNNNLNNNNNNPINNINNTNNTNNKIIEKRPNTILVKRLKEDSFNELIILAKQAVEQHKLFDATHYYKKACKTFEEEKFASKNIREAASRELYNIYHQLLMIKNINESHEAINDDDHEKLEWHMNNMKRISHRIDKNSSLAERASNHYEYFYNQLNKIKSENLGVHFEQ